MDLESARDIVRGVLILAFAGLAFWGDHGIGVVLLAVVGVLILQSAFSGWCPADVLLRALGLKRRPEDWQTRGRHHSADA